MAGINQPNDLVAEEVAALTTAPLLPPYTEPDKAFADIPEPTIFSPVGQQLSRSEDGPSVRSPPTFGFQWTLELLSLLLGYVAFAGKSRLLP